MERRTYALLLAYDGTPYKGWQPHPRLPTVGGVVAAAMRRAGVEATPYGASRTDAGVHARGQVASFHSRPDLDLDRLADALVETLPSTIRLRALRPAPRSFHSHWSSNGKVYRYRAAFRPEPGAAHLPWLQDRLEPAALLAALRRLVDAPDLSRFVERGDGTPRMLARADAIAWDDSGLTFEFAGPAFGKYMVRNLVAAALSCASGEQRLAELDAMIAGQRPVARRAPPEGLTLWRVRYPLAMDVFADLG